jgi:anti-sigma28 factor (negative regulator of flagellin synthesis)
MRIDDLNRAPQPQESAKTEGVRPDRSQNGAASRQTSDGDAASISGMAAALSPNESRLEALRLQVERGQYDPSSNAVAAKLIDEHTLDQ